MKSNVGAASRNAVIFLSVGFSFIKKRKLTAKRCTYTREAKKILIWEIGAIINLQPAAMDGGTFPTGSRHRLLNYFRCKHVL